MKYCPYNDKLETYLHLETRFYFIYLFINILNNALVILDLIELDYFIRADVYVFH